MSKKNWIIFFGWLLTMIGMATWIGFIVNMPKVPVIIQRTEHEKQTDFLVAYILGHECSTGHCLYLHKDTNGVYTYGPAQFQRRTFNYLKGLAGQPDLQWKNEDNQRWLLRWAVEHGYGMRWQRNYVGGLRAYYEGARE
jgi:hypothetical protein